MQSISLAQLIKISPLNQTIKDKALKDLPSLGPLQKFELSKTLWRSISLIYRSMVKEKVESMLDEMAHAKAIYEKEDFINAENEIFNKLLVKIDETQSREDIETLKSQLKNSSCYT